MQLTGYGDTIQLHDEIAVYQNFPKSRLWEMRGLVMRIQKSDDKVIVRVIIIEALRSLRDRKDVGKTVAFEVNPSDQQFCRIFKRMRGELEKRTEEAERAARYSG